LLFGLPREATPFTRPFFQRAATRNSKSISQHRATFCVCFNPLRLTMLANPLGLGIELETDRKAECYTPRAQACTMKKKTTKLAVFEGKRIRKILHDGE
jgi:hypothetical protein